MCCPRNRGTTSCAALDLVFSGPSSGGQLTQWAVGITDHQTPLPALLPSHLALLLVFHWQPGIIATVPFTCHVLRRSDRIEIHRDNKLRTWCGCSQSRSNKVNIYTNTVIIIAVVVYDYSECYLVVNDPS